MKKYLFAFLCILCAVAMPSLANDDHSSTTTSQGGSPSVLAQNDSCQRACQDANKSCVAKVDPSCNSRGCVNERNACTSDYNDCIKKCGK